MNNKIKLLFTAVLFMSATAHATQGLYVKAFGGMARGNAHGLDSVEPDLLSIISNIRDTADSGLFGAAIGRDWTSRNFPISTELMVMHTNQQAYKMSNYQPLPSIYAESDSLQVSSNVFLLNAIYHWPATSALTPFFGAGVGVAQNTVSAQFQEITSGGWMGGWRKRTRTNFIYDLTAGLGYAITPNIELALAYQFLALGKVTADHNASYSNQATAFDQTVSAKRVNMSNMILSLSYKF